MPREAGPEDVAVRCTVHEERSTGGAADPLSMGRAVLSRCFLY